MDILIRTANMMDLEAITQGESACFPAEEAAPREVFRQRIETFPESFLIAECEGRVIGFINGAVTDERTIRDEMYENCSLHCPGGAYQSVFGLDVLEEYRHEQVAARLMKRLIELSQSRGKKGLILTCKEHLLGFYEQFGYVNCGVSASVHGGAVWYDMILEF